MSGATAQILMVAVLAFVGLFMVALRRILEKAGFRKAVQRLAFLPVVWLFVVVVSHVVLDSSRQLAVLALGGGVPLTLLSVALFAAFSNWPTRQ